MLKRWWLGLMLFLLSVSGVSAQDEGSTLQAWADTPGSALNLTQQMSWPIYTRQMGAINTYTAAGEPALSCAPTGHAYSVWVTFVASQTGVVQINARGSNYDAVVAVFKTTPTNLVRCENEFVGTADYETIRFKVVAGARYYLMFAATGTGQNVDSNSSLLFTLVRNAVVFGAYQIPASGNYSIIQPEIDNALNYLISVGDCGYGSYWVYYSFKPSVSGRYEFSTAGSSYDTTLMLMQDGSIVSCNRNISANNPNSRLRPTLTAGLTYIIGISEDTAAVNPLAEDIVLSLRVRKL